MSSLPSYFPIFSFHFFFLLGSIMSLAMGLVFGGLAAYGAMQTSINPKNTGVGLCKWHGSILQINYPE